MSNKLGTGLLIALLLAGCKSAPSQKAGPDAPLATATTQAAAGVIARVGSQAITLPDIQGPLVEGYGLNVLLQLVQLEVAKQELLRQGIADITAEDVQAERKLTLDKLFQDAPAEDRDKLLEQFLNQRRISRPEFELVLKTNAYLRKLAQPMIAGKITDENLQEAFGILYGENVKVRHIQVANLQEIGEARRRLSAGEPFEKVARELSRDAQTAPLGGELPQFSRNTPNIPASFKEVAFSLKPGEVSEPVQAGGAYHLIRLEQKIAPKAVKFEDVKEAVRQELHERWLQATINQLRQDLAQQALRELKIEHPALRQQFEAKLAEGRAEIRDRDQIRKQMERDHAAASQPASTAATQPEDLRPPATESGAAPDQPTTVAPTTAPVQR